MRASCFSSSLAQGTEELRKYWATDQGRLIHAFKAALALLLSMGLCMRLELTPPRTAMVTVAIVMMHQQAGMVIARGFYRVIGMAIGSCMGLLLIACFDQQPGWFFLALSLWIGLCVWGASYYRNYQSYAFVLAGYATSITAVPVWSAPYGVFDSVVYSLSEVVIGVLCASLVSALVLPQHVAAALLAAGQRHGTSFLAFLRKALAGDTSKSAELDAEQIHLLADRPMLEGLRSAAVFEDPELRLKNNLMVHLNQDFLDANTALHVIGKLRVRARRHGLDSELAAIDSLLHELASILPVASQDGPLPLPAVAALRQKLQTLLAHLPQRIAYHEIQLAESSDANRKAFFAIASAFYFAVADLDAYLENFIALRQPVIHPDNPVSGKAHVRRVINTANNVAALSAGLRAMAAVLMVSAMWFFSGWNGGASGLVAVSIATALFAVMPNPAVATRQMVLGCAMALITAFLFNFFVLPKLDGFWQLAACMAPVIMAGSYINTFPKVAIVGLGFNIYFCFIGNITNPHVYDPAAFLDTGFALMAGMVMAAFAYTVIAPYGGGFVTRGYVRQLRRLVAGMACRASLNDELPLRFESHVRDFTLQVASQPAGDVADKKQLLNWAFAALETGWSVIEVRMDGNRYCRELPGWPSVQRAWLDSIAKLFDAPTRQHYGEALNATRSAMDALPVPVVFDASVHTMARFRMWALLHAVELSLQDEVLPLHASGEVAS
jgi:uncharacterized membrane protein YccC